MMLQCFNKKKIGYKELFVTFHCFVTEVVCVHCSVLLTVTYVSYICLRFQLVEICCTHVLL